MMTKAIVFNMVEDCVDLSESVQQGKNSKKALGICSIGIIVNV
jgi:hypothetical protein